MLKARCAENVRQGGPTTQCYLLEHLWLSSHLLVLATGLKFDIFALEAITSSYSSCCHVLSHDCTCLVTSLAWYLPG
jgi:hypothetical protein